MSPARARKVKSFQLEAVEVEEGNEPEPILFEVGDTEVEAYGSIPGSVLLDFLAYTGPDATGQETAKAVLDYLKASMDADNWRKFSAATKNRKNKLPDDFYMQVIAYLIEERSSRPTEAS